MFDYEHKRDPVTGDDKLYIVLERGDCDLESIVRKLMSQNDFTPAKLRFYWEEMLEVGSKEIWGQSYKTLDLR